METENEMVNPAELLSITQAAAELNVGRPSIYAAIQAGKLTETVIAGKRFIRRSDLIQYQPRPLAGKREGTRPPGVKGPGGQGRKVGGYERVEQKPKRPRGRPRKVSSEGEKQ